MRLIEIQQLIGSTSDAAYAIDEAGQVVAWNRGAEELFGIKADQAIGRRCGEVVQGSDECGPVCSPDCTVMRSTRERHPVHNFDLQIPTPDGPRWCNVSVLVAPNGSVSTPYSIHIARSVDTPKRLELLVRDFVVHNTSLPADQVSRLMTSNRAAVRAVELSPREIQILRLVGHGLSTAAIAHQCHISRTTVNNHVQHILRKLDTHSRLEAVRRAEKAGLI